jgi:hypothetical protein
MFTMKNLQTVIAAAILCLIAGCAGTKPPPGCEGAMRPLNSIKLSSTDSIPSCMNTDKA